MDAGTRGDGGGAGRALPRETGERGHRRAPRYRLPRSEGTEETTRPTGCKGDSIYVVCRVPVNRSTVYFSTIPDRFDPVSLLDDVLGCRQLRDNYFAVITDLRG